MISKERALGILRRATEAVKADFRIRQRLPKAPAPALTAERWQDYLEFLAAKDEEIARMYAEYRGAKSSSIPSEAFSAVRG